MSSLPVWHCGVGHRGYVAMQQVSDHSHRPDCMCADAHLGNLPIYQFGIMRVRDILQNGI